MILSDREIALRCDPEQRKNPLITPFKPAHLQPASVDLTLDQIFLVPDHAGAIDLGDIKRTVKYVRWVAPVSFTMKPGTLVLGSTAETVHIPDAMVASIEGKSSIARLGLFAHVTAGWLDPGFRGKVTLELVNLSGEEIILRPGLRICQVAFARMDRPAEKPYGHPDLGSKYQDQRETTASRYAG